MNEPQHNMRRPGIIDLMIVTTAMAFIFMLQDLAKPDAEIPLPLWFYYPYLFAHAVMWGLVLPTIYWIPVLYARTGKMFCHPGHWMLGAQFVVLVCSLACFAAYMLTQKNNPEFNPTYYASINFVHASFLQVAMIVSIFAAIKLTGVRWKIAMLLFALSYATKGLVAACQAISMLDGPDFFTSGVTALNNVVLVIASIGILVAALIDWKSKVSRDWLHRVGLTAAILVLAVIPLLSFFYIRLVMLQSQ